MFTHLQRLWRDQRGAVISSELVLLTTVGVFGLCAGLSQVQRALNDEFADLAAAIRSMNQSYSIPALSVHGASCGGSLYVDSAIRTATYDCQQYVWDSAGTVPAADCDCAAVLTVAKPQRAADWEWGVQPEGWSAHAEPEQ